MTDECGEARERECGEARACGNVHACGNVAGETQPNTSYKYLYNPIVEALLPSTRVPEFQMPTGALCVSFFPLPEAIK